MGNLIHIIDAPRKPVFDLDVVMAADFVSPWCYIGLRQLKRAIDSVTAPVGMRWQPNLMFPDLPPEGANMQEFLEQKVASREKLDAAFCNLTRAGEHYDIDFRFDKIPCLPNTLSAHYLMMSAAGKCDAMELAQALFSAFFEHGMDIGQIPVLQEIASYCGCPTNLVQESVIDETNAKITWAHIKESKALDLAGLPEFQVNGFWRIFGISEPNNIVSAFDHALFPAAVLGEQETRLLH